MHRLQMKQHDSHGPAHLWNALIVVHEDEGTAVSPLLPVSCAGEHGILGARASAYTLATKGSVY